MNLSYSTLEAYENAYAQDKIIDILCKTICDCGSYYEMQLETVNVTIANKTIQIMECPIMICQNCGDKHICPDIPYKIYKAYIQMDQQECTKGRITIKGDIKFKYAQNADFIYDSRDISIPGLGIDLDPTNKKGFSCPVFFKRNVLNNFFTDDEYELDFFSESYGEIGKKCADWPYEWKIAFGINKNNNVVMFLGDLDQIDSDDPAIYWLKSYNIASDHCIVDTELYRGQFECKFSDPIKEKRIISLRNSFFKKMKDKYDVDLFHLEQEVENKSYEINKPINYSRNEIKDNIIILDGVLNEGIDCAQLRILCSKIVNPAPTNLSELKTRKLLQSIIAVYAGQNDAYKIISPLFYLNDLRVCFAHLIPQNEIETKQNSIVAAFGLNSISEYQKLYDILIDKLYFLYRYLNVTDI